jgi:hypothetical protein
MVEKNIKNSVCLHAARTGLNVWSRKCSQQWQKCWWISSYLYLYTYLYTFSLVILRRLFYSHNCAIVHWSDDKSAVDEFVHERRREELSYVTFSWNVRSTGWFICINLMTESNYTANEPVSVFHIEHVWWAWYTANTHLLFYIYIINEYLNLYSTWWLHSNWYTAADWLLPVANIVAKSDYDFCSVQQSVRPRNNITPMGQIYVKFRTHKFYWSSFTKADFV